MITLKILIEKTNSLLTLNAFFILIRFLQDPVYMGNSNWSSQISEFGACISTKALNAVPTAIPRFWKPPLFQKTNQ